MKTFKIVKSTNDSLYGEVSANYFKVQETGGREYYMFYVSEEYSPVFSCPTHGLDVREHFEENNHLETRINQIEDTIERQALHVKRLSINYGDMLEKVNELWEFKAKELTKKLAKSELFKENSKVIITSID